MKQLIFILQVWLSLQALGAAKISGTVSRPGRSDHSDAVVYAERSPNVAVNPPQEPVLLDQRNLTFIPHVLPVVVGTTVNFPNNDEVLHNVFSYSEAKRFNLGTYPKGTSRQIVFDKPGEVALLCYVHLEMSAFVLVVETPYFAVTPEDGSYRLDNLPAGRYQVSVWHERYQPVSETVEIGESEEVTLDFELDRRR